MGKVEKLERGERVFSLHLLSPPTLRFDISSCLSFRWPTEGLYPSVATPFRHRFLASALSCFGLFHFLLASFPLFIAGLRPDQAIQTGGCGCSQLPWRDGDVVVSRI